MGSAPSIDPVIATQVLIHHDAGHRPASIAALLEVSDTAVRDIIHGRGRWATLPERPVLARLREEQSRRLELAYRSAAAITMERALEEDKLQKASTYQLITSSAIAIDKARLLAGESTANIEIHERVELAGMDQLCTALARALVSRETSVDSSTDKPTKSTP